MGRYFFFIIILLHFSQAIGAQDRKDLTKKNNDHPFVFTSDKGRKDLILKKNNYSFIKQHPNEYLALEALKYCSKDIIPILIEEIADTTMVCPADFRDPLNSTLEKANKFFNNRSGIRYAHMLEFYLNLPLSKEVEATIERLDSIYPDYDKYKWRYYKVYNAGMIFRTEKNKSPIYQTLSAQDMKNIYIQYLNWRNANKNRSLDEIRAKYKNTSGILRYPYKWF